MLNITKQTPPADRRPYRRMHEPGPQVVKSTMDAAGRRFRETWKQVGWQGQTGAFYSLDEHPSDYEPGSYAPMWVHIDSFEFDDGESC